MNTHIILIGYRGTGKSTLARLLAARVGLPAFDSDPEIERRAGKTIAEIFAQDGEAAFRDHETRVLTELLESSETPIVLATGGGAVLSPENRRRLKESGRVLWLTASPETILQRLQGDPATATTRPSLTNLPAAEEIVALLEARRPLYEETAHETVDTETLSPEEIAERILEPGPGPQVPARKIAGPGS